MLPWIFLIGVFIFYRISKLVIDLLLSCLLAHSHLIALIWSMRWQLLVLGSQLVAIWARRFLVIDISIARSHLIQVVQTVLDKVFLLAKQLVSSRRKQVIAVYRGALRRQGQWHHALWLIFGTNAFWWCASIVVILLIIIIISTHPVVIIDLVAIFDTATVAPISIPASNFPSDWFLGIYIAAASSTFAIGRLLMLVWEVGVVKELWMIVGSVTTVVCGACSTWINFRVMRVRIFEIRGLMELGR